MNVERIKLTPEQQAPLLALRKDQAALETFSRYVMAEGERRAKAIMEKNHEEFAKIAKELGLDLNTVVYNLSDDGTELVPVGIRA